MTRNFQKICNSCDYHEIYKIVEANTGKQSLSYKDIVLNTVDLDFLKEYTISNIVKFLHSDQLIPDSLIKTCFLLGDEHIHSIKSMICGFIISRKSADISQFIEQNFQDPGSLKKIYEYLEQTVESITTLYSNLPSNWDIDLKLVNDSLIMVKQALCQYFFIKEVVHSSYSSGLISTIHFERKLDIFFTNKKCCVENLDNDISTTNDCIKPRCIHKTLISRVFIPFIDIFFENKLLKISDGTFQQNIVEKNIIKDYINFFKELEYIYVIASYFDNKDTYLTLITIADKCLYSYISKTKVEDDPSRMLIVLSTTLYVQNVLEEFISNILIKFPIEIKLISMEASRKLEKQQAIRIERLFNNNFSGKIADFEESFKNLFIGHSLIADNVRYYVLELCMSQLFSKISLLKMNNEIAIALINDIKVLEGYLKHQFESIPYYSIILDYLKIFAFPIESKEDFVKNFSLISGNRFDFIQILKALEDQQEAMQIYDAFKKINK